MSVEKILEKPIILIICNYYLPGYKSGGGLRTLVHMVERFHGKFDFRIVTFGWDADGEPYPNVKMNEWNDLNDCKVFYLSKDAVKISKLRELVTNTPAAAIYLNSVFSVLSIYLLLLRKFRRIPNTPVILAPEGELSDGALELKAAKKKAFVRFAKTTQLYQNLIWKVTAEPEKAETERFKGKGGEIFIAPNMPSRVFLENYQQKLKLAKIAGHAKMVFLSRYMRKKNFKWLVDNLVENKAIEGELEIDVFGPIEDEFYWQETQKSISLLPPNIRINYLGHIFHEQVLETLFKYHFFVLPTIGENFGHVFVEALSAGCPLLISDRTPWRDLQKEKIGWDLSLEKPAMWIDIINFCISLNDLTYSEISSNARIFANRWLTDPKIEADTLRVLNYASRSL